MRRGRVQLADTGKNLLENLDEVEHVYLHGGTDADSPTA
jgi:hypothetical protein